MADVHRFIRMVSRVTLGLFVVCVGMTSSGCKKKTSKLDRAFQHTAEHAHGQLQDVAPWLREALKRQNLEEIHDNIYQFESRLIAFTDLLEADKKERLNPIIKELGMLAQAIDNTAGRGNQAATEANAEKLIEGLKRLETAFRGGK